MGSLARTEEERWGLLMEREKLLVQQKHWLASLIAYQNDEQRAFLMDHPGFCVQLEQQQLEHEQFCELQRQLQKPRVDNLGEELASLMKGRSKPDFLSPWYSTTSIEVRVGRDVPDFAQFEDEKGEEIMQQIEYEWKKPTVCYKCQGCKKKPPRQGVAGKKVWRIKKDGRQRCNKQDSN